MSYRDMVTTTGWFNVPAIMAHAHQKARAEINLAICVAAGRTDMPRGTAPGRYAAWYAETAASVDRSKLPGVPSYAKQFAEELRQAWAWAHAIKYGGQGEAPARTVPMFRQAA